MAINVRWGIYAGGAAFLLALVISIIIGHAGFGVAILRALCFAAIFFVLGTGAWTLINAFIPELLFPESNDAAINVFGAASESDGLQGMDPSSGSRVNITVGDRSDVALPDDDGTGAEDVGNIADLMSGAVDPAAEAMKNGGLDEKGENSYTGIAEETALTMEGFADPSPAAEAGGGLAMNFDSFAMGGGEVTGLEPFGDSFSLPGNVGGTAGEAEAFPERKSSANKPVALEGDFNPKDIALGIRTVLERDKKG